MHTYVLVFEELYALSRFVLESPQPPCSESPSKKEAPSHRMQPADLNSESTTGTPQFKDPGRIIRSDFRTLVRPSYTTQDASGKLVAEACEG